MHFFNILKSDQNCAVRSFCLIERQQTGERSQQRPTALQSTPTKLLHILSFTRKDVSFLHLLAPQRNYSRAADCRQTAGGQTENQLVLSHELKPGLRNAKKKKTKERNRNLVVLWITKLLYKGQNRASFCQTQ